MESFRPLLLMFTAAQAAEKIYEVEKLSRQLFTAAQAAEK